MYMILLFCFLMWILSKPMENWPGSLVPRWLLILISKFVMPDQASREPERRHQGLVGQGSCLLGTEVSDFKLADISNSDTTLWKNLNVTDLFGALLGLCLENGLKFAFDKQAI
ncbi:hypothetical protein SORBI_3005G115350 [Sorghum bicolor]|uniref:Uncharacterized protein n=1 Tax=Sorghum bicolor TaxID=4558 RepID=A0A1Z5RI45_SORBI|nr:hypothetical protein SORBI_3005G115350 [Sorghum bicolor]